MEVRKTLQGKPIFGVGVAVGLLLLAGVIIAREYWPQRKPDASQAYLTDNDGKTWYVGSAYSVPPLDHTGKTAVFAEVFTYDGGSKQFCGYLQQYTPDAKKRLEASIADAVKNGQSPGSAKLFQDHWFMQNATLVKAPGPNNPWIPISDPAATTVMAIHSPDGSSLDNAFVY
ncbi:MAG TPA: hypothetical protein VHX86_02555 [Tepidisphaeraceae bacterium]|jgi:hypothetical protein|nr:hypothetical protein [Tepidisphaeraceae bacterium]